MDQTTEAPVTIDNADESILESWNSIRGGDEPSTAETTDAPEPTAEVAGQPRDASGKFTKAQTTEESAAEVNTEHVDPAAEVSTDPAPEPTTTAMESPKSMPKDLADKHWGALSPEVQSWVHKRDADYEAGINRYRQSHEAFSRMEAAFAPYQETLQRLGAQPEQAIGHLLGIDHMLRYGQPAEKAAMLVQIAQQFGVPLEHLSQVNPMHQQMLAQAQKVHGYESQQAQAARVQAQRDLDALTSEVMKFSDGKEHFATVEQDMLALLPGLATQMPNASVQEKLQRAYDLATVANPTVRAAIEAQRREAANAEARKKAIDARKAAATNRIPRGNVATTPAVGSMEDTIRAKAAELGFA